MNASYSAVLTSCYLRHIFYTSRTTIIKVTEKTLLWKDTGLHKDCVTDTDTDFNIFINITMFKCSLYSLDLSRLERNYYVPSTEQISIANAISFDKCFYCLFPKINESLTEMNSDKLREVKGFRFIHNL